MLQRKFLQPWLTRVQRGPVLHTPQPALRRSGLRRRAVQLDESIESAEQSLMESSTDESSMNGGADLASRLAAAGDCVLPFAAFASGWIG